MQDHRVRVASIHDFPALRAVRVVLPDDEVAVWQVEGQYYAVSAVCLHHHVPTLHQGERNGLTVSCPLHGWIYSLETGEATHGGGRLQVYVTEVDDGSVWIHLPGMRHEQQS